jgi:hypothetical protein
LSLAAALPFIGEGAGAARLAELGKTADRLNDARRTERWAESGGPGGWSSVSESMSARAADYQARVTGVPSGTGYVVSGVKFDGYRNGVLLDAKGPGYAKFVKNGRFRPWYNGAGDLASQARRQLNAAGGTPITWYVAEEDAVGAMRNLFVDRGISGINIEYMP